MFTKSVVLKTLRYSRPIPVTKISRFQSVAIYSSSRRTASTDVPATKLKDEVAGVKKPKHVPFVKNLFLGKFDKEVLTYPEVLTKDQHDTTEEMYQMIEKFFNEKVDSKTIDQTGVVPEEVLDGIRQLGTFGLQIPTQYGGLELNATQYARVLEGVRDPGIFVTLGAHQSIGLKGILLFGTDAQKEKYLPKLATGEHIAAFCLTEASSGSDAASIKTKATRSEDGKTFYLDGTKIFISNGGIAEIFTVFAKTQGPDKQEKITAFIVERSFGNVISGKPEDKMGIKASNTTTVTFDKTPVPAENVIGQVGEGFKVAVNILNSGRFSMGSAGAAGIRKILADVTEYAINREQFKTPLKDFEVIKGKFASMACGAYAMESMAYLTAGMLDTYDRPDCSVEAAIVKVFSSEEVGRTSYEALQIMGGVGYMKELPYERYCRDVRILPIFEGTNEILRMFIALMGCQHAGVELSELVRKMRNPFMNPNFFIKEGFKRAWPQKNPKLDIKLYGCLHPSLEADANLLEYSVKRLAKAVEMVLERHGKNVLRAQLELYRLADIAIDVYAMTAVLGRASRSYCIGLPNTDSELALAKLFVGEAYGRVMRNYEDIRLGPVENGDSLRVKVADAVFQNKGYFGAHPLARNWW